MTHRLVLPALLALTFAFTPSLAAAQTIGTFRWQLSPYCNVVTATVTQMGAIYRLDGTDDQCGVGNAAAVTGEAQLNASGGVSLGFTIVTAPSGRPVHVSADIGLPSASGLWRDSAGATGTFVLLTGAAAAGSPRPQPTSPLALGGRFTAEASLAPYGLTVELVGAPLPGSGAAVAGRFGDSSGVISPGRAGVWGDSGNEAGVIGTSAGGNGVLGFAYTGVGVHGLTTSGTALRAEHSAGGTALELVNGAIRVSGATRPAFRHLATVSNVVGNLTRIDHPQTNLDPAAILFVNHVFAVGATVYTSALGVYYDEGESKWTIFNEDLSSMPVGAIFNVLVVKQ